MFKRCVVVTAKSIVVSSISVVIPAVKTTVRVVGSESTVISLASCRQTRWWRYPSFIALYKYTWEYFHPFPLYISSGVLQTRGFGFLFFPTVSCVNLGSIWKITILIPWKGYFKIKLLKMLKIDPPPHFIQIFSGIPLYGTKDLSLHHKLKIY